MKRVTIAAQLIEQYLTEGCELPAVKVLTGLPPDCKLVDVAMKPGWQRGNGDVVLTFSERDDLETEDVVVTLSRDYQKDAGEGTDPKE